MNDLRNQPESYWKEKLTPEQYKVCRMKGTERAFTGALYNNHEQGMYECVACGQPLRPAEEDCQIHHRNGRIRNGPDMTDNLELLHANCHRQIHVQERRRKAAASREGRL